MSSSTGHCIRGRIDEGVWFYRTFGSLFLFFGLAALLMAGLGLYSILSSTVTRRRRALGVRIALGADPRRIVGMVSRHAVVQVGGGMALGLAGGWLAAGMVQLLAFRVDPRDPSPSPRGSTSWGTGPRGSASRPGCGRPGSRRHA